MPARVGKWFADEALQTKRRVTSYDSHRHVNNAVSYIKAVALNSKRNSVTWRSL